MEMFSGKGETIKGRVVCGTGHRPDKLGGYSTWDKTSNDMVIALSAILSVNRPSRVISGMAQGWDSVLALAAIKCDIPLDLHIPCKNHSIKWPKPAQELHQYICDKASTIIYISEGYTNFCMQKRNESMVNSADIVLALWNGTDGGTHNCIRYAKKVGKPIVNLWSDIMEPKPTTIIELPNFIDTRIQLRQEDHVYLLDGEESGFISATTLLHNFFPAFNPEKVAQGLLKYPKYKDKTVDSILSEWADSNETGSLVHSELEQYIKTRQEPTHYRAQLGREWLDKMIARNTYRFWPEVILYVKDLKICGTTDLLLEEVATGHLHVMDYKCIKKLRFSSFDKEYGWHPITAHLMNCNFIIYSLQLSLYRYILETYYNRTVCTNNLIHIRENDVKVYRCIYYKSIIEQIMKLLPDNLPVSDKFH